MIKIFSLSFAVFMSIVASASAQVTTPDELSPKPEVASQSFILSQISSIGVDTLTSADVKIPGHRHEIKALYQRTINCPPNLACATVMPPPAREATVVFRERELADTATKARVLNTCRRTIEQAGPNSQVLIKGKISEVKQGNRVFVRSLESCSVGSAPQ